MDTKDYLRTLNEQLEYLKFKGLLENWNPLQYPNVEKLLLNNEFLIKCPYAGDTIEVQVLFNIHEPWASPDFTVMDNEFMKNISIDDINSEVPCLNSWNYMSEDIIQVFLSQLVKLYKKYQLKTLQKEELLFFEYESLLSTLKVYEQDIEFSISSKGVNLASILIKLPLNLEDLPPVFQCRNPGPPGSMLLINLRRSSGVIVPKLFIAPQVESLLENHVLSLLPTVPAGSSLTDYADNLLHNVRNKIKTILHNFDIRKQIIAELLCNLGNSLLEYDAEKFTSASFLFNIKNISFIATVNLADRIPEGSSRLVLRSVCYRDSNGLITLNVKDMLPDLVNPQSFAETIQEVILKSIPTLKNLCDNV